MTMKMIAVKQIRSRDNNKMNMEKKLKIKKTTMNMMRTKTMT
jgi:hypothetical protein